MNVEGLLLVREIQERISASFGTLRIKSSADDVYGDIIIAIDDRGIYYSNLYQEVVTKINIEVLWPQDITNVIFVLEEGQAYYSTIGSSTSVVDSRVNPNWEFIASEIAVAKTDWSNPLLKTAA